MEQEESAPTEEAPYPTPTDVTTDLLPRLWRNRIRAIMGQIAQEETEYQEVASLAEHIGADYHDRFLVELLQNAEDQATKAGLTDATVIVIRTKSAIAVLNQGAPFNERGMRSITSAGISAKDAQEALGNKGVGFKAVFQVTDRPEIYTAPENGTSFMEHGSNWFQMQTNPFDDTQAETQAKEIIEQTFTSDNLLSRRIQALANDKPSVSFVLDKLRKAAPFKFPRILQRTVLDARISELELSNDLQKNMSTLVVLPLLTGQETSRKIDEILDTFIPDTRPGSVLLFLKGVSRLELRDHVRHTTWVIERITDDHRDRLPRGAHFSEIYLRSERISQSDSQSFESLWWLAQRRMGKNGDDDSTANQERKDIHEAVKKLPGNWGKVDSAYAAVAFPRFPNSEARNNCELATDGKLCIGLPTTDLTGTPIWISGPFHGNVSRTGIDLDTTYNGLIFSEAILLFWDAIERIKTFGDKGDKQAITLYFQRSSGCLAKALSTESSLSSKKLVLSSDDSTFLSPCNIKIPSPLDSAYFRLFFHDLDDLSTHEFVLPNAELMEHAADVLKKLSFPRSPFVDQSSYLDRNHPEGSLLERAAVSRQCDGPQFWESFLTWCFDRFGTELLLDQSILPVGNGLLKSASDRVFFLPIEPSKTEEELGFDDIAIGDAKEESVEAMPKAVSSDMRFFDESCVKVRRSPGQPPYTELASTLTTATPPLVLAPRRDQLLKEVLAPALVLHSLNDPKDSINFILLDVVARWVSAMTEKQRQDLELQSLRVPVYGEDNELEWVPPTQVYFGESWLNTSIATLLHAAYGDRPCSMLIPWHAFSESLNEIAVGEDKPLLDRWRARMRAIGVADKPRILPVDVAKRRVRKAYLKSDSRDQLTIIDGQYPPFGGVQTYWKEYLDAIRQRPAKTLSGQRFYIRPVTWIDGLEDEHRRTPIVEILLRSGSIYASTEILKSEVSRSDGSDSTTVDSFWIHTLKAYGASSWSVFPSSRGGTEIAGNLWQLAGSERQRRFVSAGLAGYVPDVYCDSITLLNVLGIHSPTNAPLERFVSELHALSDRVNFLEHNQIKPLNFYAQFLYDGLQERCAIDPDQAARQLAALLTHHVPLIRGEELVPADLRQLDKLYLNDDPERASHIPGFDHAYCLPLAPKKASARLFKGLIVLLGEKKILRTSESALSVHFDEDPSIPERTLSFILSEELEERDLDAKRDIACLLAFGRGEQSMDVGGERLRRSLDLLDRVLVKYGHLADAGDDGLIYDERAEDGPTLFVECGKDAIDIIGSVWRLYSPAWRLLFQAYATVARGGTSRRQVFFKEQGVTDADWDLLDAELDQGPAHAFTELKPAVAVFVRRNESNISLEKFEQLYKSLRNSPTDLATWIGIDLPFLETLLQSSGSVFDDSARLTLAKEAGIDIDDWQDALGWLGKARIRIPESIHAFEHVRWRLAGLLFARSCNEGLSLDYREAREIIEIIGISNIECPDHISWRMPDLQEISLSVVKLTREIVQEKSTAGGLSIFDALLSRLLGKIDEKGLQAQRVPEAREREISLFLETRIASTRRAIQAKEDIEGALRVARSLAQSINISLDEDYFTADVQLHRYKEDSWWGNRFAALRRLKTLLGERYSTIADSLDKERAFSGRIPWSDLLKRFGLPPSHIESVSAGPVAKSTPFLSYSDKDSREVEDELENGSEGELGKQLTELVDTELELASMSRADRNLASNKMRRKGRHGTSSSKPKDHRFDQLVGALGEAFVYVHFLKSEFPEFDHHCWVSENRERYGLSKPEEAGQGYDFRYLDVAGKLTGYDDQPLCYIEVKSSAGEIGDSFPMSINEWEQARLCHEDENALYIIIRVSNVRTHPAISDVILNPYGLWKKRLLSLSKRDLSVSVGARK